MFTPAAGLLDDPSAVVVYLGLQNYRAIFRHFSIQKLHSSRAILRSFCIFNSKKLAF